MREGALLFVLNWPSARDYLREKEHGRDDTGT